MVHEGKTSSPENLAALCEQYDSESKEAVFEQAGRVYECPAFFV
jgi:hypothetical protein